MTPQLYSTKPKTYPILPENTQLAIKYIMSFLDVTNAGIAGIPMNQEVQPVRFVPFRQGLKADIICPAWYDGKFSATAVASFSLGTATQRTEVLLRPFLKVLESTALLVNLESLIGDIGELGPDNLD